VRSFPLAAALLFVAACKPSQTDDPRGPPDAGTTAPLYANDPSLMFYQFEGTTSLLVAYDDESGLATADTESQTLTPLSPASANGLAISNDLGASWTKIGPIAPASADCGDPACAIALAGSPSLSPQETFSYPSYASLAYTKPGLAAPDAVATSWSQDLVTWSAPRVVGMVPGGAPSRPSYARQLDVAVIVYTDPPSGALYVGSSMANPPSFDVEQPYIAVVDQPKPKDKPIVRVTSRVSAHVAYLIPHDTDGTQFDLRLIDLFRNVDVNGNASPWDSGTIFRFDGIAIDPTLPGALGRSWRDAYPYSFEVGNGGTHYYIAFRERSTSTGQSTVFLVDCDATQQSNCSTDDQGYAGDAWRMRAFPSLYGGGQYMPVIAADWNSSAVSIAWLEQATPGSTEMTMAGILSLDDGDHFTAPRDLRTTSGGPWTPCPTAAALAGTIHSYGEHIASMVLPWGASQAEPTVITAHPDSSGGCMAWGQLTFDQHIGIETW
jgi:hypothetical protein